MRDAWSSQLEPHLLSLPFALAPAAMLIVIAYTAVMRGAPVLRGWLFAHALGLLPYAVVVMLAPSITDPALAEALYRISTSVIPLAAACGTGFQLSLLREPRRYRALVWFAIANAVIWIPLGMTSSLVLDDVRWLDAGLWYPVAGRWAWAGVLHTVLLSLGGFIALGGAALRETRPADRRRLRAALVANLVTYAGLTDLALAYGIGVFPLGWLLSGVGCLLVVRALVVDDLLRVRAIDTTAPRIVLHFAGGALLAWVSLAVLGPGAPWWGRAATVALSFVGVRTTIATFALIARGGRTADGPLERLLAQLVGRARAASDPAAIAGLAIEAVDLGIGVRPVVLLASEQDWGWTRVAAGAETTRLADADAPDPLVASWLAEDRGRDLRAALVFADDLERAPAELRPLLAALLEHHGAQVVVPVRSADELLALIALPAARRRPRGRALAFVQRAADRLAEALLHARMAVRAAERARLAREVELAATVQAALLPGRGAHVHGAVTVVGSWRPATRCAGDLWGVYPLGDGRTLVAIGDVTGHGVASAMVTAAAVGACEVYVRRARPAIDLRALVAALDAAVRQVGGGELAMTLCAAVLDPAGGEITYVSCGHPAAYVCRPGAAGIELAALVGRGNPLATGASAVPRVAVRPLGAGDLVVWYTDGVIEAHDPSGAPYGDRRLQRLLKRLDARRLAAGAVHDVILASVAAHRAGAAPTDDETIVVAEVRP